jgi:hypothetical protein
MKRKHTCADETPHKAALPLPPFGLYDTEVCFPFGSDGGELLGKTECADTCPTTQPSIDAATADNTRCAPTDTAACAPTENEDQGTQIKTVNWCGDVLCQDEHTGLFYANNLYSDSIVQTTFTNEFYSLHNGGAFVKQDNRLLIYDSREGVDRRQPHLVHEYTTAAKRNPRRQCRRTLDWPQLIACSDETHLVYVADERNGHSILSVYSLATREIVRTIELDLCVKDIDALNETRLAASNAETVVVYDLCSGCKLDSCCIEDMDYYDFAFDCSGRYYVSYRQGIEVRTSFQDEPLIHIDNSGPCVMLRLVTEQVVAVNLGDQDGCIWMFEPGCLEPPRKMTFKGSYERVSNPDEDMLMLFAHKRVAIFDVVRERIAFEFDLNLIAHDAIY